MKNLVLFVLIVIGMPTLVRAHDTSGATIAAAPESALAPLVADIVDAFHNALAKGDTATAHALLDENVEIFEQGWVEHSRAEYAAHHLQSDIEFSAVTRSTQTARSGAMLGDLAYVITEGRITGTYKGKPIDSITLETMVLRQSSGRWRIIHIHWSSRSAAKN